MNKMNTYAEIKNLIDRSNKDYIYQFIEYVKGNISRECEVKLRECLQEYTKAGASKQQRCSYVIKRGANNGKQCSQLVRDNSDYCTKHKKYEKPTENSVVEENTDEFISELVSDEEDVVDDDDVQDNNTDEVDWYPSDDDNDFYE